MVLDNLSLDVFENDILMILGSNGCGKTTLLRCIMRLMKPRKGNVTCFGKDLSDYSPDKLAHMVGYVPQMTNVSCDYKVSDYMALGRTPHLKFYQMPSDEDYEIVLRISDQLNIKGLLNHHFNKLSGGQQQLVNIARVLVQQTPIIVMDEPASSLDFENQAHLLNIVRHLGQDGKTVILTTHNPNHALALNSKVCMMSRGTVKAVGFVSDIFSEKIIQDIYSEHVKLYEATDGRRLCGWA